MKTRFVRYSSVGMLGFSLFVTACGPSDLVGGAQLKGVKEGMSMEQVDSIIGPGQLTPMQPADSMRLHNGIRTQVFLVNGQRYTVWWYRDTPGSIEEDITREKQTPILFHNSQVIAKGWADFDKKAEELDLPNPYRSRERLDSIAQSQMKK